MSGAPHAGMVLAGIPLKRLVRATKPVLEAGDHVRNA